MEAVSTVHPPLVSIIAALVRLGMGLAQAALAAGPQERVGEILAAVSAVMHDPQLQIFQPYAISIKGLIEILPLALNTHICLIDIPALPHRAMASLA
jgi:hypothetical protein